MFKKEKALAAKIIDKHLRPIFAKAILKGYDMTLFSNISVPSMVSDPVYGNTKVGVRFYKSSETMFKIGLYNEEDAEHGGFHYLDSEPELFVFARGIIDDLEQLADSLPACRPVMTEESLTRLDIFIDGLKNSCSADQLHLICDSHYYPPEQLGGPIRVQLHIAVKNELDHFLADGRITNWCRQAISNYQDGLPLSDEMIESLIECNKYLAVLNENELLLKYGAGSDAGAYEKITDAIKTSLQKDLSELIPSGDEFERKFGKIQKLLKEFQAGLFDFNDPDLIPGWQTLQDFPGVSIRPDHHIGDFVRAGKGAIDSWNTMRDLLINGDPDRGGPFRMDVILQSTDSKNNISMELRPVGDLSWSGWLVFPVLHQTGHMGHNTLEPCISLFTSVVARQVKDSLHKLLSSKSKSSYLELMKDRSAGKKSNSWLHKPVLKKFTDILSQGMSNITMARHENWGSLRRTSNAQYFPIGDGWFFFIHFGNQAEKDITDSSLRYTGDENRPPVQTYPASRDQFVREINFSYAASTDGLKKKIVNAAAGEFDRNATIEALVQTLDKPGVLEGLKDALSRYITEIRDTAINKKNGYYQVFEADFPEDLMEEFVMGGPEI